MKKTQSAGWAAALLFLVLIAGASAEEGGVLPVKKKAAAASKTLVIPSKAATSCTTDADCPAGKCCWEKNHTCLKCTSRVTGADGLPGGDAQVQGASQ